jgi:hypothetical protein
VHALYSNLVPRDGLPPLDISAVSSFAVAAWTWLWNFNHGIIGIAVIVFLALALTVIIYEFAGQE